MQTHVVIIGAGPAGLTAAYLLAKEHQSVTVLEADPDYVGGIARTVKYKDYCFDIGGHRFFSKSKEVENFWDEILPHDMLQRPRLSRIYYRGKFFSYPLKLFEVVRKLGIIESFRCFFSYVIAKLFPIRQAKTFSQWVRNHFGHRLFSIFFKTYTEKVWGMCCDEISADWAAQRIKGLSFFSAITNAIFQNKKNNGVIKTLIDSFRYPRQGPGMLWEECARKIKQLGGIVQLNSRVTRCELGKDQNQWHVTYQNQEGKETTLTATHVISTAAIRELVVDYLKVDFSVQAKQAANQLQYRDFLIVVLILKDQRPLSDNWIYVHDSQVDVARIQNFKAWSPDMVPDPTMCCYGMEYFCFEKDSLWSKNDSDLIQKAIAEINQIGLAKAEDVADGCVVRQVKAYPVYDDNYKKNIEIIREELEKTCPHLFLIGRNGMHKYNNQDHAMMTAMLTVKNILAGKKVYNVWRVNQDAEYIEAGVSGEESDFGLRAVPERVQS